MSYYCSGSNTQKTKEANLIDLYMTGNNLEKDSYLMELQNQCRIIRTTELATAQEKLNELESQKAESEAFHRQLLDKECDLPVFVLKYKRLQNTYYKCSLTHLAAKASLTG